MTTHALQRFAFHLEAFKTALATAEIVPPETADAVDPAASGLLGHRLYMANGRTPVFMLQGLARVHRKLDFGADTPAPSTFDRIRLEAKIVEDIIGKTDFWWVIGRKARENKLPAAVIAWAGEKHVEACGEAATWLRAREWIAHRYLIDQDDFTPRADRLTRKLRKLRWPSPKKLNVALREFLSEALRETDDTIEALDLGNVEHGLHEARRRLRWFSVYATALSGAVILDGEATPPPNWERYLTPDVVENPFNRLPTPEPTDRPVSIPAPLFYALSYVIDRLGRVKDRAQWTETLSAGLKATGSGRNRSIESYLGADAMTQAEAGTAATEILEQALGEDALLTRMAEAVEG